MNRYQKLLESYFRTRLGGWTLMNILYPIDKRLMRWSNGRLNSGMGTDLRHSGVLLRCLGAKSGKPYDIPLLAAPMGEQYVLIASATGRDRNPAWYHNLKANPECTLLVSSQREIACIAREAKGDERERGWAAAVAQYSGYNDYQSRTKRQIPVMVLTPKQTAGKG